MLRDTVVQINLKTIATNMDKICQMVGDDVAVMAVVKANAYGHGAVSIAPTLIEHGASYLAVATMTEALEIRKAYREYPIFILGHTPDRLLHLVVEENITQTIFSESQARIIAEESRKSRKKAKVHIKIDTGFHRLGTEDLAELKRICAIEEIEIEGIFTHLALVSDEENEKQYKKFINIISELEKEGMHFKFKHITDSISAVDYPDYRMNMIRPGALIYGLKGFHKGFVDVKQAMTFTTKISQLRQVSKGEGVGYDYLWKAPEDMVIGTLPFGYADGYPRNMRDRGYVTVKGVKCPVIGVICMDQCMADFSKVPDVKEGDTAIIYGDGTNNSMTIEEASKLAETNKNEIVVRITARPPREYIK
ncbi:alanine racemase [Aminipila terrae]|uniref:Alanine racemase n=1 Tax=Aminipila terrae TaxID=2697030 RepID=A0A6P1MA48_9FIRM|nr:alanine racemase [Aminipila terrae]QHI71500.1 alanine racemase [Aminipila terrae]